MYSLSAVHDSPSNIVVTSQYPGSPRAKIRWSFAGESSDLTYFRVVVEADGNVQADMEVPSGIVNDTCMEMLCY